MILSRFVFFDVIVSDVFYNNITIIMRYKFYDAFFYRNIRC